MHALAGSLSSVSLPLTRLLCDYRIRLVDITARDLPPRLSVWDSRSGERTEQTRTLKKTDKLALKEMFPECNHKSLRITHVDLGEEDQVRVWIKARKS